MTTFPAYDAMDSEIQQWEGETMSDDLTTEWLDHAFDAHAADMLAFVRTGETHEKRDCPECRAFHRRLIARTTQRIIRKARTSTAG